MGIVHPGDSNRILLGPKRGHFMVNGMLAGVNLFLLPSSCLFLSFTFKKEVLRSLFFILSSLFLLLTLLGSQGSAISAFYLSFLLCGLILLLFLEMAVACIQSYVFTVLSSLYLSELMNT